MRSNEQTDTSATSPKWAIDSRLAKALGRRLTRVEWVPGLRFRTGGYARTVGIVFPKIEIDPLVREQPEAVFRFCLYHEAAHALGFHNLWRMNITKFLLLPLYPLIVRWQEWRADCYAQKHMKGVDLAMGICLSHNEQHTWFGRFVYGTTWLDRFSRAF